ncbi:MAG TPA: CRTAC1 family protein, partial [Verrucomicrobiae bacterium]|nr:CRTAC1 family protein [Verrucomicrobiae bacterium]
MSFHFRVLFAIAAFVTSIQSATMDWRQNGPHRSRPLAVPAEGATGFSPMGIAFTNRLADSRSLTNQIFLNGAGVAAGDVDGDGWTDLYFCGLDNRNELFRNLGNWRFESITDSAGLGCPEQPSTGATFADVDGDNDLDLLVNGVASGTRLFLNDGRGRFTEATQQWGLTSKSGATSLAVADIDGDGFLDLYVVNYRSSTFRDEPDKRFRVNNNNGRYELLSVDGRAPTEPDLLGRFTLSPSSGLIENGEPDQLYRNISGTRFEKVTWNSGVFTGPDGRPGEPPYDWGLSAMFHDVNGDGAPDLYVCNDFQSEDRLWINDGRGKFRLATKETFAHTSLFSMGVDFADLDGDGRDEIFVADMLSRDRVRRQTQMLEDAAAKLAPPQSGVPQFSRNSLFWNRGDGTFAEIGQLSRLAASEWSWCPAFLDVDLDGYADLIVTAGHERDAQHIDVSREIEREKIARKLPWREQMELRRRFPKLTFPLMAFRNNGNLTFDFKQAEWGFDLPRVAQGMCLADLDNDGDLDLAINCLNSPALLYRNNTTAGRVAVRLRGKAPNTRAIGARITMVADSLPNQSREVTAGGRYLSGDDAAFCFAAASATNMTLRVRWRNGAETILTNVARHRLYELSEEDSTAPQLVPKQIQAALFEDLSAYLNHTHQDQAFDDFRRQPLIPHKLSTLGPGVAWYDCDGDGWEELLIGSGRTGRIAVFHNERGQLQPLAVEALCRPGTRDRTSILGWQNGADRSIVIGSANYEDGLTNGPAFRQFDWKTGQMDDSSPGFLSSAGPLAIADADGDGDLDLFLGGRVIAAQYPQPASSQFFRNENGKLV